MKWVWISLCVLVLLRLVIWRQEIKSSEQICARIETINKSKRTSKIKTRVRTEIGDSFGGQKEFISPIIEWPEGEFVFPGAIQVPNGFFNRFPSQSQIEFEGVLLCEESLKNFSVMQDSPFKKDTRRLVFKLKGLRWRAVSSRGTAFFQLGSLFRWGLNRIFNSYPHLHGVVWAAWTGGTQGLDPRLVQLYREAGLLPLIALSGQHVSLLVWFIRKGTQTFLQRLCRNWQFRRLYKYWELILPLTAAFLLSITSGFVPSILRTLAMASAVVLLRFRKCLTTNAQILSVSSGLLILWDPELITGIGFLLSFAGTFLILDVSNSLGKIGWLKKYFVYSLLMPIVLFPCVVFFFGQWSYLNPICQVLVSWLWVLFMIPLGFVIPIFAVFPKSLQNVSFHYLDRVIQKASDLQIRAADLVHFSYLSFPRLTWIEVVFLILILLEGVYLAQIHKKTVMQRALFDA